MTLKAIILWNSCMSRLCDISHNYLFMNELVVFLVRFTHVKKYWFHELRIENKIVWKIYSIKKKEQIPIEAKQAKSMQILTTWSLREENFLTSSFFLLFGKFEPLSLCCTLIKLRHHNINKLFQNNWNNKSVKNVKNFTYIYNFCCDLCRVWKFPRKVVGRRKEKKHSVW